MRQYVAEILAREPSAWRRYRDRHAAYFGELLHQLDAQMRGSQPQAAYSTMRAVFDDVRAAWLWLVEKGDFETLTRQMLPALFRHGELDIKGFTVLPLLEAAQRAVEGDTTSRDSELYLTILLAAQGAFYRNGYPLRAELMPDVRGTMFADHIERAWSIAASLSNWEALGFWGVLLAAEYAWTAPDANAGMQQLRRLIGELRRTGRRWDLAFALQSLGRALSIRLPDINPRPVAGRGARIPARSPGALRGARRCARVRQHPPSARQRVSAAAAAARGTLPFRSRPAPIGCDR